MVIAKVVARKVGEILDSRKPSVRKMRRLENRPEIRDNCPQQFGAVGKFNR